MRLLRTNELWPWSGPPLVPVLPGAVPAVCAHPWRLLGSGGEAGTPREQRCQNPPPSPLENLSLGVPRDSPGSPDSLGDSEPCPDIQNLSPGGMRVITSRERGEQGRVGASGTEIPMVPTEGVTGTVFICLLGTTCDNTRGYCQPGVQGFCGGWTQLSTPMADRGLWLLHRPS